MICDKERFEVVISLRDVFAGLALLGDVLANNGLSQEPEGRDAFSADAYAQADSMLKERSNAER